jgi:hypothetical protein
LHWWAGEATLAWIVAIYVLAALVLISLWRKRVPA